MSKPAEPILSTWAGSVLLVILFLLILPPFVVAQQSEGYRLSQHLFNAGGGPRDGSEPVSSGYRISASSIGQLVGVNGMRGGLQVHYPGYLTSMAPPVEVTDLLFDAPAAFRWNGAPLADHYHVYRDSLAVLGSGSFGSCQRHSVYATDSTDSTVPTAGSGFFYLICASNRLWEEGPPGYDSEGVERRVSEPCP